MAVAHALDTLLARGDIWRGGSLAEAPRTGVPTGFTSLDEALPAGGWPRGEITELLHDQPGIGELSLLLPSLSRLSHEGGWLALVSPPWNIHAPAWAKAGIALERLVLVQSREDSAWCAEQLLRSDGFAAVLLWDRGMDTQTVRRFQVAAECRQTVFWLWRPQHVVRQASPAPLRLALAGEGGAESAAARACERALNVSIVKRRGRPAGRPLRLMLPTEATTTTHKAKNHALAGPAVSTTAYRSTALAFA